MDEPITEQSAAASEPADQKPDRDAEGDPSPLLEDDEVEQRLKAAVEIPVAALFLLLGLLLAVAWALLASASINVVGPPAVAGLAALGIVGVAARGGIRRKSPISFGRLLFGIAGVGLVAVVTGIVVINVNSGGGEELPAGTVAVVATEFEFDDTSLTASEGEVTFVLEDKGQVGHSLTIEGREADLRLQVTPNNPVDQGSLSLDEGTYVFYCDVKGHRELGMEGELVVKHVSEETEEG